MRGICGLDMPSKWIADFIAFETIPHAINNHVSNSNGHNDNYFYSRIAWKSHGI